MHSIDRSVRRLPRRNANDHVHTTSPRPVGKDQVNPRTHQLGRVAIGAGVGAVVGFLLVLAASGWLPGTSIVPSAATTPSLVEQPDNARPLASNPLIPIVIRQSTPPEAQVPDLPPDKEISPPLVTVPKSVDSATTRPQLDLRDIEDAKRVQKRLIDLGFLFGVADGKWGSRSRRALQDFKAANGIGDNDTWDDATQERLLTAPDANAAATSDITFIGGWAVDAAACRKSAITITAQRASDGFGAACEFHSTQRESLHVWRLRALCANNSERWNADIRLTLSTMKLTWSSERGTTTYVRCPS
jgi:Putative peptidoglycan binding domain